ncbi:MAG: SMC family ATPase [Acidobacteria bacterium]|nr:SMC family ATPase [Acidobacteriota bacterium]
MRPVELRLRNFRSYFGDEASFDFRGRRLVGIVGPIGSGKSSILDAIAFALYGRTASVGKGTKALIHQRAEHAAVAFRFDIDGDLWEAQRMLRKKGAGDHALYRLKDDSQDAEKLEQIVGEAEVNAKIVELLGLDFDAFGRSVMLAQGRFAEFLTARPAERDSVLKGVFGLDRIDRMRAVAKERAGEAEIEAEKAEVAVRHLIELEASTASRKEVLGGDLERLGKLEEIEPRARQLAAEIDSAGTELEAAERRLAALRKLVSSFPEEEQLVATVSAARTSAEQRNNAALSLERARDEIKAAEARSAKAAEMRGTLDAVTALVATRLERETAVSEARKALTRGEERSQQAATKVGGQTDRVALAQREMAAAAEHVGDRSTALAAAEVAYHDASHADMAATLRRDLSDGAICPVCEQAIQSVPEVADVTDVEAALSQMQSTRDERDRAEAANTKASAALESARTALEEATRRVAESGDAVTELKGGLDQAAAALDTTRNDLVALVGSDDVDAAIVLLRNEQAAAAAGLDAAATKRDRAGSDHDAAIEAEQTAGKHLADLRVALSGIATQLDDGPAVADDPESIANAALTLRTMLDQALHDTTKRSDQASKVGVDHERELAALVEKAGVTGTFDEALAALRSRVEVMRDEIARADDQLEGKADRIALRDGHIATMTTNRSLAADLTDARFVRYLLDDERRRLAELGSEHFQLLTSGRYRFTEDGAFDIVDLTAADAVRKAASLSGGETFLASLGLALAMAEIVARGGGRLDAFFLDEGFGTLDPEHLDLAMEGIESLVSDDGNRLVVVVSHVPELRHRVEDLIELDRNPTTGDTRVLSA